MTKYNFLCIDIGTTSLKAALVSETGQVLSFLKINFNSKNIRTLSFEWMNAVKTALLKLNNESKEKVKIDAISISGNGPTIVTEDGQTFLWNEKIKIKRHLYGWNSTVQVSFYVRKNVTKAMFGNIISP